METIDYGIYFFYICISIKNTSFTGIFSILSLVFFLVFSELNLLTGHSPAKIFENPRAFPQNSCVRAIIKIDAEVKSGGLFYLISDTNTCNPGNYTVPTTVENLIILLLLLALSGFFSGSETALTSLSMARVESFVKEKRTGAQALQKLKANTNRMLIAILIGNNLVNIGASVMATVLATEAFGQLGPGLVVGVLTLLILVFGEIAPKTIALQYAGQISLTAALPLLLFSNLVSPLVWILERAMVFIQSLIKGTKDPAVTELELITLVEHGAKEGTIESDEKKMIERIFAFNELRAQDVMIPKHKLFVLDCEQSIGQALRKIAAHPYTRFPLCSHKADKITRIVYLRDVLKEVVKGHMSKPLRKVSHEKPLYAPLNQPIEQLFSTLRDDERRPVIVVDEYGVTQGMFTLEDMLEELVGEIHDEIDKQQHVEEVQEGELLVNGSEELRIVEDHLAVYLSGKPTDTVSHWILDHVEHIPTPGERFTIDGLDVLIEKASKRRIRLVRLKCLKTAGKDVGNSPEALSLPGLRPQSIADQTGNSNDSRRHD